eukprot:scaffold127524_cov45-Phaeocystis_antarctica.AAC.1
MRAATWTYPLARRPFETPSRAPPPEPCRLAPQRLAPALYWTSVVDQRHGRPYGRRCACVGGGGWHCGWLG